jgi:hypothetical protein
MPMTRSRRKLREAQFFLTRLREDAGKDSEAFSYYLSAFLGAADSVIDIGRKEAKIKQIDFESWKTTSLDETERKLAEFMTDQRNAEVHRDGANTAVASRDIPVMFYPHVEPLPIDIVFKGSLEEGPSGPRGLPHWVRVWIPTPEHVFREASAPTAPVLDECNRYYRLLDKFLQWAEALR